MEEERVLSDEVSLDFYSDFEGISSSGEEATGGMINKTVGIYLMKNIREIMVMQQDSIKQLENKVKEHKKCKQVLVELRELKSTVKEYDCKIRALGKKKWKHLCGRMYCRC